MSQGSQLSEGMKAINSAELQFLQQSSSHSKLKPSGSDGQLGMMMQGQQYQQQQLQPIPSESSQGYFSEPRRSSSQTSYQQADSVTNVHQQGAHFLPAQKSSSAVG